MSKAVNCLIAIAMVTIFFSGPVLAAPPPPEIRIFPGFAPVEAPWPMVNHDFRRSGLSPANTSRTADHVKWVYDIAGQVRKDCSPVIDAGGTIYIDAQTGLSDGKLVAIKADGKLKWSHEFANYTSGSAAIGRNGVIYIRTHSDALLYALNNDGSVKWSTRPTAFPQDSPLVGPDGAILCADDWKIAVVNPDQSLRWNHSEGGYSYSAPTVTDDGKHVYWPNQKNLLSINYTDGWTEWDNGFATDFETPNVASVDPEGIVYYGSKAIHAVRPDGTEKWVFTEAGSPVAAPAIGPDDNIYISSNLGSLIGIRRDNTKMWSYAAQGISECSPAISADGTIFIGAGDGKLHAVKPDGTPRWVLPLGTDALTSPAIGADGTVYVTSVTGKLYAVGAEFQPPSAPQEPQANAGPGFVQLSWQPPASDGNATVTGYTVYRAVSNGSAPVYSALKNLGAVLACNDTDVTNGLTYMYCITARNSYGEGKRTEILTALPVAPPSAPLNLAAKAGNRQAILSWSPPADNGGANVTNFRIYRGLAGSNLTFLAEVGNVQNYTDAGLQNGKSYAYKITAKNSAGESAATANITAKPKAPAPAKSPGFGAAMLLGAIVAMAALARRPKKKQ